MADIRLLTLTGRVGNDPEIKMTKSGAEFCSFRLANRVYPETEATWYTVTCWNKSEIEFCKNNVKKGSSLYVVGQYSEKPYESKKTGETMQSREISAKIISFTYSGKPGDDTQGSDNGTSNSEYAGGIKHEQFSAAPEKPYSSETMPEEDLPF